MRDVICTDESLVEAAIRSTVPGTAWYIRSRNWWYAVPVERVLKTMFVLTNGVRVMKSMYASDARWGEQGYRYGDDGGFWQPPTPEVIEIYERQQLRLTSRVSYRRALKKLQGAAQRATPAQLQHLATQVGLAIDLTIPSETKP